MKLLHTVAIVAALLGSARADDQYKQKITGKTGWEMVSDYSLKEPFDRSELKALANKDSRSGPDNRRLMHLILRAAIEKDRSFMPMLNNRVLRKASNVDLALSGYDYMLSHSDAALDHILAVLATEPVGADTDTIVVLSCIDEWDRSIRAFRKHFIHTDGAGSLCMTGFMETRAYLYPAQYKEHAYWIEAPITRRPLVLHSK